MGVPYGDTGFLKTGVSDFWRALKKGGKGKDVRRFWSVNPTFGVAPQLSTASIYPPSTCPSIHSPTQSSIHLPIRSPTHSSIHHQPSIYPIQPPSSHLPTHPFTFLFTLPVFCLSSQPAHIYCVSSVYLWLASPDSRFQLCLPHPSGGLDCGRSLGSGPGP